MNPNPLFERLRKVKSHTFRGNKYKIVVKTIPNKEEAAAFCEAPDIPGKKIVIDPRKCLHDSDRELLKSLIDESIHACLFEIDNETVDQMSFDIASFLYRAGYRMSPVKQVI